MILEIIHKGIFGLMLIMFTYGNYIVILKFLQLRKEPNSPLPSLVKHVETLKGGLWYLDFSATVSPIVGLLGTVLALIIAFKELSLKGISGADEISSAIGTALWATAAGIAMSLWFYFFYKYFQAKVSSFHTKIKLSLLSQFSEEKIT